VIWCIDIETVPLGTDPYSPNGVPDWFLEDQDGTPAQVLDAWKARALNPYTARVVAIALSPADGIGPNFADPDKCQRVSHADERRLMTALDDLLREYDVQHLVHWGSYDPPVLREAMVRHDLHLQRLATITRQKVRGRAWYPDCLDASLLTHGRHCSGRRPGLKSIAADLGWGDPAQVKSTEVYDAFLRGDLAACAERAAVDVALTLRILERERALSTVRDWAGGDRW
jgi:hypothetical protein